MRWAVLLQRKQVVLGKEESWRAWKIAGGAVGLLRSHFLYRRSRNPYRAKVIKVLGGPFELFVPCRHYAL